MAGTDPTTAGEGSGPRRGRLRPGGLGLWTMFVLLLLVALVPVLLVQVASYYRQYRVRRAAELAMDVDAARALGESFELHLEELRKDETAVARAFFTAPAAPRQVWNHILAQSIADEQSVRTLSWVDLQGRILASSDPGRVGRSVAASARFRPAQGAPPWLITNASRSGRAGTFLLITQMRDRAGARRGFAVAEVDPAGLTERLALQPMNSRVFSLVDQSGWLVYRYPPARVALKDRDLRAVYPNLAGARRTQQAQSGVGYDPAHHERHLFAIVPLPSLGWLVAVAHPEGDVTRPIAQALTEDAAILALVALLAFGLAAAVARRVAISVERLSVFARGVGGGNFALRAPSQGPREIRHLASAFNRMADRLQLREQEHDRVLELERAQAREARILEAIQEHTATLLAYFDRELRFRHVNTAYCRFLGRRREEVIGRGYAEVSDSAEVLDLFTRVRDSGETLELHEFARPATQSPAVGDTYWDVAVVPVLDEGREVEGVVVSATDITPQVAAREQLLAGERARAEAERTRARVAETVAAETNHRMKNNLALISGMLQLQVHYEPRESPAARALQQAIARISALAVVHEELYTAQPGRVDLGATLQRVAQTAISSLAAEGLAPSCDCPRVYVPAKVGSTLAVVANEMVTNAIKHGAPGPEGKRQVNVRFALRGPHATLGVWNSGHPVPEDFDIDAQSGMGLHLIQGLAEAQVKGALRLYPAEGGTWCEVVMEADSLDLSFPPQEHDWQI